MGATHVMSEVKVFGPRAISIDIGRQFGIATLQWVAKSNGTNEVSNETLEKLQNRAQAVQKCQAELALNDDEFAAQMQRDENNLAAKEKAKHEEQERTNERARIENEARIEKEKEEQRIAQEKEKQRIDEQNQQYEQRRVEEAKRDECKKRWYEFRAGITTLPHSCLEYFRKWDKEEHASDQSPELQSTQPQPDFEWSYHQSSSRRTA